MVGTSGSSGERLAVVTAMGRNLPERTCWMAEGMLSNMTAIWLPSRSEIAGALPL